MVAAVTLSKNNEEEVFPFHFCAVIPGSGKEEAISYDVHAYFTKERIAKLIAAFNIITDQRPGCVEIYEVADILEFKHDSAFKS